MKIKMLVLVMGLLFSLPGFAFANPPEQGDQAKKAPCDCQEEGKHHHMMHKDWQAHMAEKEQKLLTWVDQYTPDKKEEWTKVLEEKKALRNKWMSPENAQKREQWKKERMAKMEELKNQLDEGKITKDEFIQKVHGGKGMGHWKTFHELRMAVEKKDNQQAANLLNQLLEQYKQHNVKLNEMLK
jgi:hypothetical protein